MKTIPISKPGAGPAPTPDAGVQIAKAARERAISILSTPPGQQPTKQSPVGVNPNAIAAEDVSALHSQVGQNDSHVEESEAQAQAADPGQERQEPSKPAEPKDNQELPPSQMAIIARKERALRAKALQQENEFKAKEAALNSQYNNKIAELEAKLAEYKTGYLPKSYIKQNTLDAMEQSGVTYDEYTQQVMTQQPTDPRVLAQLRRQEQVITDLQAKVENSEKAQRDQQSASYQSALRQIETDVKDLVKVDPTYEAIRFTRSEKDVVELIERTYQEEGRVMSVDEAAQEVENYLVDEASKLARLDKIKKRLNPPPVVKKAEEGQQTPKPQQSQPMKTLTNSGSATRKLSARERAMLAFKGELKS